MDWLAFLILMLQAVIAFPVLMLIAYVIGWGFMSGAAGALLARMKRMDEAMKKDEREIL